MATLRFTVSIKKFASGSNSGKYFYEVLNADGGILSVGTNGGSYYANFGTALDGVKADTTITGTPLNFTADLITT